MNDFNVMCISSLMFLIIFVIYVFQLIYDYRKTRRLLHRMEKLLAKMDKTLEELDKSGDKESIWVCEVGNDNDI